ncbi:MAG TPA: hypothetical protein VEZ20_08585 [Allosphingosinicella sp.]|jgi:hypothetical protein|nr:hypothetical protein [Allosphingosinicella sp.]
MIAGLFFAGMLAAAEPAPAAARQAWARCVWERVPASAANWLRAPRLNSRSRFDETGPHYALQQRLVAACHETLETPGTANLPMQESHLLQRALIAARPAAVGAADTVEPNAHRCDRFFADDPAMARQAGTDWGFGAGSTGRLTSRSREMYGFVIAPADLTAIANGSGGAAHRAANRLLAAQPRKVATRAEGEAGQGAFVLGDEDGLSRCFVVQADGSMMPAPEAAR